MDEMCMYLTNRPMWIVIASELLAQRINEGTYTDKELAHTWQSMARDYQMATWPQLFDKEQDRIRALRDADAKRGAK